MRLVSLAPGVRIGSYEIIAQLGVGGMGEVYRATDSKLKRQVAIKVLPPVGQDPNRLARFQREAEVLAQLNHPNIAHLYGVEDASDVTALVMELVEGPTLADRIARGALPVAEALPIAQQIAEALEAAHERGIVHRDLKPANIKVRDDGTVKVLDFGLAKALGPDGGQEAAGGGQIALSQSPTITQPMLVTGAGMILGTAAYMSPEQARGRPIDKRTDIWAFGCVLYEMLTGRGAFRAEDSASTLARVLEGGPNWSALPSAVSPAVHRTLELCLRKEPRNRLRDIGDVRLALEGELTTSAHERVRAWRGLAAIAALMLGILLASTYFTNFRAPTAPPLLVSRFTIRPPSTATLASLGGLDLAISSDGRRIAFFAREGEADSVVLYVRDLDGLYAKRMAGTEIKYTGAGNMNPFFSADGRSIGLLAPDRGIVGVPVDGMPPVRMLDPPKPGFVGATWTADNTLIYSSGTQLQRVSAGGGGTPEPLNQDTPNRLVAAPVPLPGRRAVLFHAFGGGTNRVAVLDLDTKEEKTLIEGASNATYLDTGHLVFVRGGTLMAVPFSVTDLTVTGDAVALVQGVRHPGGGAADFVISGNGTLAYVPASAETESTVAAVWIDRRGKVLGRALPDPLTNGRDPRLSPDGKRLLLVTGPTGDGDLWNYDLAGRPPLPLALPNNNVSPVWSPDGRQVAFGIGGNSPVLTLPADGSVSAPRVLSVQGQPKVWSAADELFFQWPPGVTDILAIPASGTGDVRKIVTSEYSEFDPALSPNGRWLAYASNRTGQNEIWVQGYPDGVPVRVSGFGGREPQWSADGREIFYWQNEAFMAVAVQTGQEFSFAPPQRLFSARYSPRGGDQSRSYAVAPDGRFLMFQTVDEKRASAPAEIVVVQNFSEELKQRVRPGSIANAGR